MTKKRKIYLFIGDIIAIIGAFISVISIRSALIADNTIKAEQFIEPFSSLLLVWIIVLFIFNLYEIEYINPNPRNIGILAIVSTINILLGGLIFYFFPYSELTPKLTLVVAGILAFMFLMLWRRFFYKIFSSLSAVRIFIIGSSSSINEFTEEVQKSKIIGRIMAVFPNVDEQKVMQKAEEIGSPDIVVAETIELEKLVYLTQALNSKIMPIEEAYEELFAKIPISHINNSLAMQLASKEVSFSSWIFQEFFCRIVAFIVLLISSPILLLASIAILIEDGRPIFLRQKRVGKDRKYFSIYKLRSMRALAPDGSAEQSGAQWAEKKDPRVTTIGRIIRKLHIDEIPQMFNVLNGDINLIGPRPERPEFVENLEKEIPYYFLRHTIKPGFTGWAQIKFRYARTIDDSKEKFEYDLFYIKNQGFIFDTGILLKTAQIIFTH